MAEAILSRAKLLEAGGGGSTAVEYELATEIITENGYWTVPRAKDQSFSIRLFGGGGGGYFGKYGGGSEVAGKDDESLSTKSMQSPISTQATNTAQPTDTMIGCGGGGGYMNAAILVLNRKELIQITIGKGGATQATGGTSSFGTYLSAAGGGGATAAEGGSGGSGGGAGGEKGNGGNGSQFGGGGGSGTGQGGNGGTWGGGGGGFDYVITQVLMSGSTKYFGSKGGCGNGGCKYYNATAGKNTVNKLFNVSNSYNTTYRNEIGFGIGGSLAGIEGAGTKGTESAMVGRSAGGGGFGGCGGTGLMDSTQAGGGGGGGFGANGGSTIDNKSGGGGGGYSILGAGGNGANKIGGGGGGYGPGGSEKTEAMYGGGGAGSSHVNGASGICIIQYFKVKTA